MESNVQKGSIPTTADNTKVNFDINSLEILFQANKSKKWVSTNAISLLARLMPHELFRQLPFGQADLSDADLRMIDSTDALIGRDLVGANLTETYLVRAKLGVRANLANAKLERASLIGVDLTEAYLGGAFLKGVNLTKAYLGGAYLGEANLASANLRRANLAGAILEKAILAGAILERAILGEAQLREAYLANANLKGAYLVGADLREADLRGADLRGANLVGADLRGANLDVTNLKGISSY